MSNLVPIISATRIVIQKMTEPILLDEIALRTGYSQAITTSALEAMMDAGEVELHIESGNTRVQLLKAKEEP